MCNLSEALVENTTKKIVEKLLLEGVSYEIIERVSGYSSSEINKIQADLDED